MSNSKPLSTIREVVVPPPPTVKLDDLDAALLRLLLDDGRMSRRQIATELGVSAPTVGERMTKLEASGVIGGYSVTVNWEVLGVGQIVYLSVKALDDSDRAALMNALWVLPEVEAVTLVTGDLDLLVRLRVRDYGHLKTFLMEQVWNIEGLQGTSTALAIAEMPAKNFNRELLDMVLSADSG